MLALVSPHLQDTQHLALSREEAGGFVTLPWHSGSLGTSLGF